MIVSDTNFNYMYKCACLKGKRVGFKLRYISHSNFIQTVVRDVIDVAILMKTVTGLCCVLDLPPFFWLFAILFFPALLSCFSIYDVDLAVFYIYCWLEFLLILSVGSVFTVYFSYTVIPVTIYFDGVRGS